MKRTHQRTDKGHERTMSDTGSTNDTGDGTGQGSGTGGDGGQTGSGGEGGQGTGGTGGQGSTGGQSGSGERTYTEAELKAELERVTKERLGGVKSKHDAEMKELLGDRSKEEVAALLAADAERKAQLKTEEEKAIEAANKATQAAEVARVEALQETTIAKLTRVLTAPGNDAEGKPIAPIQADYLDPVLELALPVALKALADEDEDPIATAILNVRDRLAIAFVPPESANGTTGGTGTRRPAPTPNRKLGEGADDGGSSGDDVIAQYKQRSRPSLRK